MNLSDRLSEREREELEALMEFRSPDGVLGASTTMLHGFLTNVLSGPRLKPSEWIPDVFDGPDECAWETIEQAQRAMTLLMRFSNEAAANLRREDDRFALIIDRIGDEPDALDVGSDWARGYIYGIALRRDLWEIALDNPELAPRFDPIYALADLGGACPNPVEDPQGHARLLEEMPDCVVDIYDWWREYERRPMRRLRPKTSPNAPCPCGSGKKYKRCCSPLQAT